MNEFQPSYLVHAVLYAATGLLLFGLSLGALFRIFGLEIKRDLLETRNMAAAILMGAIAIGLCSIIASTLH